MQWLARREYGRRELTNRLLAKDYGTDEVETCLDALEAAGYLSDQRFVEAMINSRQARGYGPMRVRDELRQRGLDRQLIDLAVDLADPTWIEVAGRAYLKRFGELVPADTKERFRRMRFLYGRGFTSEQIDQVLAGDA